MSDRVGSLIFRVVVGLGVVMLSFWGTLKILNYHDARLLRPTASVPEDARRTRIDSSPPKCDGFRDDILVAWSTNREWATVARVPAIAPDGSKSATSIVETATKSVHELFRVYGRGEAGEDYTFSVHVREMRSDRRIEIGVGDGDFRNAWRAIFDPSAGKWMVTENQMGAGVRFIGKGHQRAENGWHRIWMSASPTQSKPLRASIRLANVENRSDAYQGDGTSGLMIWGAQFECGRTPTPYF